MELLRKANWKKIVYYFSFFVVLLVGFYACRFTSSHIYTSHNFEPDGIMSFAKTDVKHNSYRQEFVAEGNDMVGFRLYMSLDDEHYNQYSWAEAYINVGLYDYETDELIDEYRYEKIFSKNSEFSMDFYVDKIKDSADKKYYVLIDPYNPNDEVETLFSIGKIKKNPNGLKLFINGKESKYTFLVDTLYENNGSYLYYFVFAFLTTIVFIITSVLLKKEWKIENKYVLLASAICLCLIIISPIYYGNDEVSHYARSMAILDGEIITESDDTGWPVTHIRPTEFLLQYKKYSYIGSNFGVIDYDEEKQAIDMEYAGVYSPISYVFSLPGLILSKIVFPNNSAPRIFLMRIVQLVICIIIVRKAIKIAPYGKKVFFGIALLPTFIQGISYVSADSLLYVCSLLLFAQVLEIIHNKKRINGKQMTILALCSIAVAISKLVYFPLVFLLLIIFLNKNTNKREKIWLTTIMAASLLIALGWNMVAMSTLTSGQGANVGYVIGYYLSRPIEFLQIFLHSSFLYGGNHIHDMMSGHPAAFHPTIWDGSITPFIFLGLTIMLLFNEKNQLNKKTRILIIGILAATFLLISVSLLLACAQIGYDEIIGIQGRYFVPLLVPLLFVLFNKRNKLPEHVFRYNDYVYLFAYFLLIIARMIMFC